MPFSINHQPSTISHQPALQDALRTLKLPVRSAKGLNQIGERLEALLQPNGRGQLSEDLIGRYVQAVAVRMAKLGKPWKQISDAEILAEVGVRKVIIAAGKSTRFSPKLARKQLALGDGFSTLLLHARQAVGFHCCTDVVAVDALVAWKCLKPQEIQKGTIEKATDDIGLSKTLRRKISRGLDAVESNAASPDRAGDVLRQIRKLLEDNSKLKTQNSKLKNQTEQVFDDFLHALMEPLVDAADVPLRRCPETGEDVLLALAKPWGPGEALIAGLDRLKKLKLASQTKYVMPIYSDYSPALLPKYAPIYLQAYMEAVIEDATITIGAKSPLDKVKDRGNIIFRDHRPQTTDHRSDAIAIREWRDMTEEQQAECERRLQTSKAQISNLKSEPQSAIRNPQSKHGLNAGVFVIDLAWAMRQTKRLHEEFDHPDPVKGKEHEYWYTDLIEIAAKQRKPRHVVFLGLDAPSGCKDARRIRQYHEDILDATKEVLLDLGIQLDPSARVRLRSTSPTFSIESAARKIFGERPDSVHIYGDVFIEDSVHIGSGVALDGGSKPVKLEGETYVGNGVGVIGSRLNGCLLEDNDTSALHRWRNHPLDEFSHAPPQAGRFQTLTYISDCDLSATYVLHHCSLKSTKSILSFIQSDVSDSTIQGTLVVPGDDLQGIEKSSNPYSGPRLNYSVRGASTICSMSQKDQDGILNFIQSETWTLLSKIDDKEDHKEAARTTRALWSHPIPLWWRFLTGILRIQTAEEIYRHAFAWLRCFSSGDPFANEKQSEIDALAPIANEYWTRLAEHDFSIFPGCAGVPPAKTHVQAKDADAGETPAHPGDEATKKLFNELTLLATHANLFDWQSPTVRALLEDNTDPQSAIRNSQSKLAIDHYAEYESMVFGPPSTFLYLTDNAGETLFDALVWFMLCEFGHKVVVAAKDKPAGGDATVEDVQQIVKAQPQLKKHFDRRNLRIISNGNDTYGTFLDRLPEEFLAVYRDPSLRAIIGKGQANLYTTVVRNVLDAPYVAQFLVKGMTAEKVTGIRLRRNKDGNKVPRPVIAIIPPGQCVTNRAPGTPGARTLKEMK